MLLPPRPGTVGGHGSGQQTPGVPPKPPRPKTIPVVVTPIVKHPGTIIKPAAPNGAPGSVTPSGTGKPGPVTRDIRSILFAAPAAPEPAVVPGALASDAPTAPDLEVGISGRGSLFGLPPIMLAAAGIGVVMLLRSTGSKNK